MALTGITVAVIISADVVNDDKVIAIEVAVRSIVLVCLGVAVVSCSMFDIVVLETVSLIDAVSFVIADSALLGEVALSMSVVALTTIVLLSPFIVIVLLVVDVIGSSVDVVAALAASISFFVELPLLASVHVATVVGVTIVE